MKPDSKCLWWNLLLPSRRVLCPPYNRQWCTLSLHAQSHIRTVQRIKFSCNLPPVCTFGRMTGISRDWRARIAITRGWNAEYWKFSGRSCRDSNPRPSSFPLPVLTIAGQQRQLTNDLIGQSPRWPWTLQRYLLWCAQLSSARTLLRNVVFGGKVRFSVLSLALFLSLMYGEGILFTTCLVTTCIIAWHFCCLLPTRLSQLDLHKSMVRQCPLLAPSVRCPQMVRRTQEKGLKKQT